MDTTPQIKRAKFSEHLQVFEYSSKSKKEADGDNDSLLLDNNEYEGNQTNNEKKQENIMKDDDFQCQLKIDQITSDLA